MRSLVFVLSLLIGSMQLASAGNNCTTHDKDFESFLDRFKNDEPFQKTRIVFPLKMSSTEPDANGKMKEALANLTLKEIKDKSILIIRGRAEAAELMGGEGKLCEQEPDVKDDLATFMQHSCHTDVYAYKYEFVRKNGCWFLQSLATSGS